MYGPPANPDRHDPRSRRQLEQEQPDAAGWPGDIRLMRRELCVQVIRESTGEIVYTMRLSGVPITLRVFEEGAYSIRIFDPDGAFDETQHGVWTHPRSAG